MARRFANLFLMLALLASGYLFFDSARSIWANPQLKPFRDATVAEIEAAVERQLAAALNSNQLAEKLEMRLQEDPRNWVVLDALVVAAQENGTVLSDDLEAQLKAARDEDFSTLSLISDCAECALDFNACTLTLALACKAPILLTPIEDLRGIVQAGTDYAFGQPIDQIDLGLSIVGLSATGLALASGGSSLSLKGGSATLKLARGLNLLSPRLVDEVSSTLGRGINWAAVPTVRNVDDLAAVVRTETLVPLSGMLTDLGRTSETVGTAATLHLLPLVDTANDATRLSRLGAALGHKTVASAELLGKSRLFRATVRLTDQAIQLAVGVFGTLTAIGALLASAVQSVLIRKLRRRLR